MKASKILHFTDTGTGPLVVLLHGYMASSEYWREVTQYIGKHRRVIAIDLLGFGKSPKPLRSRYDYDSQLTSINATLDSLAVTEPFTLVGHSMGSLVSLRYTKTYAHRVKKLVLTNMPFFLDPVTAKK